MVLKHLDKHAGLAIKTSENSLGGHPLRYTICTTINEITL